MLNSPIMRYILDIPRKICYRQIIAQLSRRQLHNATEQALAPYTRVKELAMAKKPKKGKKGKPC